MSREERVARNEAAFRRANERLRRDVPNLLASRDELTPFICECGDSRCMDVIQLTVREYEVVRGRPTRFAVVPGHATGTERVVTDEVLGDPSPRFAVIEKESPEAQEIVREADPRS